MIKTRRILVTGGAGFVGSHLVDKLVVQGHSVTVIDDLSSGKLYRVNKDVTFHHTSITSPTIPGIIRQDKPEVIFHHAASASVAKSVRDPLFDASTNINGTLRIIDAAKDIGVDMLVFASTGGAIYGEPKELPCAEDHSKNPLSPYGVSKLAGEKYLHLYNHMYDLKFTCLRYGNVYGPHQDPVGESGVIAIFSRVMLDGQQPKIHGSGDQEKDYVFIDDVVDANIIAMESGIGGTYNIGSGIGTSVNKIFEGLAHILEYRWTPIHGPERSGDVSKIILDISRAREILGWIPKVSLDDGLSRTIDYLRAISE